MVNIRYGQYSGFYKCPVKSLESLEVAADYIIVSRGWLVGNFYIINYGLLKYLIRVRAPLLNSKLKTYISAAF